MSDTAHAINVSSESGFKIEEIDLLEIAAHFFLKELYKIKPFEKIYGEVVVVSEILSESTDEILNGDMAEIKEHYLDNGTVTTYYVCRIADHNNSAETIRTLAHELVHVWQTHIGNLVTKDNGEWFWKGKSYGLRPYKGTDDDLLLPWEREADTLDLKLTRKFYNIYFKG